MHLLSSFSLGLSLFAAQSRAIAILQPASTVSEMGLLLDLVPRQCDGFACCTKAVEKPAYDDKGKAYGFENGKSCITRSPPAKEPVAKPVVVNPEPKPEEEQRPEPVDEPKPAPSPDEEKPKPVESEAPKPVESEAPKPIVTEAPKPVESEAPKPVVSEAPKPVVSEAPAPKPSPVIPKPDYTLAPLPAAVTPTANQDILSCSSANQQLMDDVATCSEPLKKASAANVKEADEMAKGAVKCICTSRWEAGNTVAKYAVQSICPAPANMTKSDQYRVYISCNTQPYKETEIIDGLGLYVRLSNGDLYEPLSKKTSPSNRAQIGGLIPLLVVLGWAFAWIL